MKEEGVRGRGGSGERKYGVQGDRGSGIEGKKSGVMKGWMLLVVCIGGREVKGEESNTLGRGSNVIGRRRGERQGQW